MTEATFESERFIARALDVATNQQGNADQFQVMGWKGWGADARAAADTITELVAQKRQMQELIAKLHRERSEAEQRAERAKKVSDNHWETLRSIRYIAKTSGDLERIIQWVNDAGSGYTETAEIPLAQAIDDMRAAICKSGD